MRKLLLAGALLAVSTATASGQMDRVGFALYGGLTVATLRGDSVPGPLNTSGFVGGGALIWPLTSRFALQPELQFVQKGDDEVDASNGGAFTEHIRLDYLEIPVLLRAAASPLRGITPYLLVGPQVAIKTSCGLVVHGLPRSYTCSDLPPAESTDWGVVGGGGLELPVGHQALTISARYDWGLRNAFKNNEAKTRTLLVLAGWRFR